MTDETQAPRQWALRAIADQGASLVACKQLLVSYLAKDVVVDIETKSIALSSPIELVLCYARLVVLDQRECAVCLGPPHYVRQKLLTPCGVSMWCEQQSIKAARKCIGFMEAALQPELLEQLASHAEIVSPRSLVKGVAAAPRALPPAESNPLVTIVPSTPTEEGKLVCAAPAPAFTTLLRIKSDDLFSMRTVAKFSRFGEALLSDVQLRSVLPHDEVVLLLCFIFEARLVGADRSHWRPLLSEVPASFPTVPLTWSLLELAELDGLELLDDVLAKKDRLDIFGREIVTPIRTLAEKLYPDREDERERMNDVFQDRRVLEWAQAVFDSRAFNLNDNGAVVLVLAPTADMVNHAIHSDILTKRLDAATGDFVMETGAGLRTSDIGREILMSYGPLQNWELLQSYGFVLDDNENERLPFPVSLIADAASLEEDDEYVVKRNAWKDEYSLLVGGAFALPRDGVPPPALLAYLRLEQAEACSYPHLQKFGPFAPLPNADEERTVWQTIRVTVQAILDVFPTSLEYDQSCLAAGKWLNVKDDDEESDDQSESPAKKGEVAGNEDEDEAESDDADFEDPADWQEGPLTNNDALCLRLRIGLKEIAHRTISYAMTHIQ